jgi:hypothetical protein
MGTEYAAPTGLEILGFGFYKYAAPTALGISVRVFRVVRGQMGTAKYANHTNKTSLGNGFWRDAENGNRDGRAPQQSPSRAANGSLGWTNGVKGV